jgi:hypothetical protein
MGQRVSSCGVCTVLTQTAGFLRGEAAWSCYVRRRPAITEAGRRGTGVTCASADRGRIVVDKVDWGCERGRALVPGCCGVVVEDPCGGLHGVFERRHVVGCVKCRFLCCILGSPCRSSSSLFRSAQAERLMVSVRKRTWSSQRAMPDRGPCTLHISLSGWFFVLGSCMKRSMGCRVIASKWATASHGIPHTPSTSRTARPEKRVGHRVRVWRRRKQMKEGLPTRETRGWGF